MTTACGVLWPAVCPNCMGEILLELRVNRWRCPRCRRDWADTERTPCPDPARVALADARGRERVVCASHAVMPIAFHQTRWVTRRLFQEAPSEEGGQVVGRWRSAVEYADELDRRLEDLADRARRGTASTAEAERRRGRWCAMGLEVARELLREVLREPRARRSTIRAGKGASQ